jgi:hypothetical protein
MLLHTIAILSVHPRSIIFLAATVLLTTNILAQTKAGSIKGSLIDSVAQQPLENATLKIQSIRDSSYQITTLTTYNGHFQFTSLDTGIFILTASFQGFNPFKKAFIISAQNMNIDFGNIQMTRAYDIMPEVVINNHSKIKIKGDTIAFKADAFKTKPDATVEDLLKKLPGIQIDRNGSIKAQGEEVQKVFVDGKEFFGNNPNLATKNLTADMIDQVQVYNDLSEQAKFNGIDDGSRIRIINLKLKKNKNKGVIGKAYGGYGTNKFYNTGITANYFKGNTQISFISGSNNINAMGLPGTMNDAKTNTGSSAYSNGFNKVSSVGLNYNDIWGKRISVNGSYLITQNRATNSINTYKQTFFADSTILSNGNAINTTNSGNQQLNFKLIYAIDSLNSIIYIPQLIIQDLQSASNNFLLNNVEKNGLQYLLSNSRTSLNSNSQPYNIINNVVWRKRFQRQGRTISLNLFQSSNVSDLMSTAAINANFNNGISGRENNLNYNINNHGLIKNHSAILSYTEPLAKNKILEINYNYTNSNNKSDIRTFNYDWVTKEYNLLIDSLSNNFQGSNISNSFGTNLKGIANKYNYQFGLAVQNMISKINDNTKNSSLEKHYINLLPNASFNYRITASRSFQFNYRGQSIQPDLRQLQNITDLRSYPYIKKGNPDLKQEFVHNFIISYNSFNVARNKSLFAYLNFNAITNKIGSSIQQSGNEQIYKPINLNGTYNVNGTITLGLPVKWERSALNTTSQIDYYHNVNLINNYISFIKDLSISQLVSFNYNYNDNLDLSVNINESYNSINYAIQRNLNSSYLMHNLYIDGTYSFSNGFILSTNAGYTAYTGKDSNVNPDYFIWNADISKKFLRNKRGELKLSLHDILNKNISFTRYKFDNSIEDVRNLTLRRYAMLTFIYRFNYVGSK